MSFFSQSLIPILVFIPSVTFGSYHFPKTLKPRTPNPMTELWKTPLGRFRVLAFVEGVSFLVILFITMPLKYMMDMPMPNKVFGLVHGFLFIWYIKDVISLRSALNWSNAKTMWALVASVLPFGTFVADVKLFRESA